MTFNTTNLHVEILGRAGFVERGFLVDGGLDVRRRVFVTQAVNLALSTHPHANFVAAQRTLDSFRAGWQVSVSRQMEADADLKLLVNVDEVWAMSFRRPGKMTQRRLLGRFIAKDIFVGLGLHDRRDLAGRKYDERAKDAIAAWEDRLHCEPLRSSAFADYLSPYWNDLDADD